MLEHKDKRPFLFFFLRRRTVLRGAIVSLIVGTTLLIVNQAPDMLRGQMPAVWQIILTYLMPYCVSTVSSALAETSFARSKDRGFGRRANIK